MTCPDCRDTPEALARTIVEDYADIKDGMAVLEPSAGIGNLVEAVLARVSNPARMRVVAFEIDDRRSERLLNRVGGSLGVAAYGLDFLQIEPTSKPVFDRVVMNPPFAKQADIDHVLHAWKFLKPGGRLVAIMSASVMFRENAKTKAFRYFVHEQGGAIDKLPDGSFAESGTGVNTCLVVIDRGATS